MYKINLTLKYKVFALALSVVFFFGTVYCAPLHSVMLTVPDHPEEALNWCGPATGQMIMEGYPSGSCSCLQEDVWLSIQSYKVEGMWDTDPFGLKEAMKNLCPPSGTWSVYSNTSPESIMHSVAYWMTANNYPAAVLLNTLAHNSYSAHAEHWVAVRGIVTKHNPMTTSADTLVFVWFNDPAVPLGDPSMERFVSGSAWFGEFQPVSKAGSSYDGDYVAIIEPPKIPGKLLAIKAILRGKIIGSKKALEYASKWIKEYKLSKMKPYKFLAGGKALEPLLVNKDYGGYYIIPYASRKSKDFAQGAIIINAYDGSFQEVGAFNKNVRYVSKEKALNLAKKESRIKKPKKIEAELVYSLKERAVDKYYPEWRVKVDEKVVRLDQRGRYSIVE